MSADVIDFEDARRRRDLARDWRSLLLVAVCGACLVWARFYVEEGGE